MHRISNAKLYDMEEGAEWWLYESCDGPTCGPDRSGVELDQWFDDPQFSTTSMPTSMMTHHWNDYAYSWNYDSLETAYDAADFHHWYHDDHQWGDNVDHSDYNYQNWYDSDPYWNMNQNHLGGADLGCKPSKNLRFRKMQRFLLMIL